MGIRLLLSSPPGICFTLALSLAAGCGPAKNSAAPRSGIEGPALPAPNATPSATRFSTVAGWAEGSRPAAPAGFTVTLFADGLLSPRWLYRLPNGDILVAESITAPKPDEEPEKREGKLRSGAAGQSANRITLLRDADHDGRPEIRSVLLHDIRQPFGMALVGDLLYVAATDAVLAFPYRAGVTEIAVAPRKILPLPAGGYNNHWTRNLLAKADGSKLYVSVGSASNVGEFGMDQEKRRAAILEINPDGSGERLFATGLRNPTAMDWNPHDGTLWTVVNERDGLGDDLVPDFLTHVRDGGFYGWPYFYFGLHEDPRRRGEHPELADRVLVPDVALPAHSASLGLTFARSRSFPEEFRQGAFVAQHGSWNRSRLAGYKVVFVPFSYGEPSGPPRDFLTGFIRDEDKAEVNGRPIGLATAGDGSLLVSDDASGRIWRVAAAR